MILPDVHVALPKIREQETLHTNPFATLYAAHAEFEGFTKDYYVVDFGPRVGVVAVREREVLLTAQYRFLINRAAWELPGGRVGPSEASDHAARRECLEETGVLCGDLKPIVSYRPGLDNVENLTTIFYSEQVEEREPFVPNAAETLATVRVPLDACVSLVLEGQITDGLTVTGILAYRCMSPSR